MRLTSDREGEKLRGREKDRNGGARVDNAFRKESNGVKRKRGVIETDEAEGEEK